MPTSGTLSDISSFRVYWSKYGTPCHLQLKVLGRVGKSSLVDIRGWKGLPGGVPSPNQNQVKARPGSLTDHTLPVDAGLMN
jgi:hypothetical protein